MTKNVAAERPELAVGETRNGAYSFKGELDSGELLTGTPTVVEVTTFDLAFTNVAINTATITISKDLLVLAGQAVQYSVSGHKKNVEYQLKITATTDATPIAQTLIEYATFKGFDL